MNKKHYRDKGSIEQRREKDAERKRRERAKKKAAQADDHDATPSELKRGDPTKPKRKPTRFADFWMAYPRSRDEKSCEQIWASKNLDEIADKIIADVKHREANDSEWSRDDGRWIPGSLKYLKDERWNDVTGSAGTKKKPPKTYTYLAATGACHVWIPDEVLAYATDQERVEYEDAKAVNLKNGYMEPDWNSPKNRATTDEQIEKLDRKPVEATTADNQGKSLSELAGFRRKETS